MKETNPICGKVFEMERWRFDRHGELSSFCHIICGEASVCEVFQKWTKGELPDSETYNPQYFEDIRKAAKAHMKMMTLIKHRRARSGRILFMVAAAFSGR